MRVTMVTKLDVQSQVENVKTTDATTGESLGSRVHPKKVMDHNAALRSDVRSQKS